MLFSPSSYTSIFQKINIQLQYITSLTSSIIAGVPVLPHLLKCTNKETNGECLCSSSINLNLEKRGHKVDAFVENKTVSVRTFLTKHGSHSQQHIKTNGQMKLEPHCWRSAEAVRYWGRRGSPCKAVSCWESSGRSRSRFRLSERCNNPSAAEWRPPPGDSRRCCCPISRGRLFHRLRSGNIPVFQLD